MFQVYRWAARECAIPDPGMYAVVGMASFLGGSGRITVFLATVMIELTDDASLIFPVGMAAIISMVVGNLFNHGLYHGLIPVQVRSSPRPVALRRPSSIALPIQPPCTSRRPGSSVAEARAARRASRT